MQGRTTLSTTLERVASTLGPGFYIGPPRAPATARARRDYDSRTVRERPALGEEAAPTWATKLQHELRAGLREDLAQVLRELARTPDPAATRPPLPAAPAHGVAE